tara:strand:+ start:12513 stop:13274 length:762 start_codon:yes stop_codon:yes gene_type:complete
MTGTLNFKDPGEWLTANEWNEVVNAIQVLDDPNLGRGWYEPSFTGKWTGTGNLKPYSIAQISLDSSIPFVEPLVQTIVDYDESSVFVTNDAQLVTNGETFTATKIGQFVTKVRYDITDPPEVGRTCGPNKGNGDVSATRTGLLCVSEPDSASTHVYVYGTAGATSSTSLGYLTSDVLPSSKNTVALLGEDLLFTGDYAYNVINATGVVLKSASVVYIFEMSNWPLTSLFEGTAKHTMFPAQLQDCGIAKTISP